MTAEKPPLLELLETLRQKLDPEAYAAFHIILSRIEVLTQQLAWLIQEYETKTRPTLEKHDERLTRIEETAEIKELLP